MKIKAVVDRKSPQAFIDFLNTEIAAEIMSKVLEPHLHIDGALFGPGEAYVQACDFGVGCQTGLFCTVNLTGVSLNEKRSEHDFMKAAERLRDLYKDAIRRFFQKGQRVQLFCVLALDRPLMFSSKSLVELDAEWVEGEAA